MHIHGESQLVAIDIPASCGTHFLCPVPSTSEAESTSSDESSVDSLPIESLPIESSPSEEPPSDGNCVGNNPCIKEGGDGSEIVILEDRDYRDFNGTRHGAAVRLINYGFQCIRCNFTSCTVTEGGGGIYIVLQKEVSLPILLQNLTFVRCQAIYGGAVYIYSDLEQNEVKIVSCVFEDNTASRVPDSNLENHLFGGAAVYLQVSNSNITNCAFRKNHGSGLKLYNDFTKKPPTTTDLEILENEENPAVSISDCVFETDKESSSSSSSSIFYVKGSNYEFPIEVKNCIFLGELSEGSYHIDGECLNEKRSIKENEKPKLRIKSCVFSSDEEKALNKKKSLLLAGFDSNSLSFNFRVEETTHILRKVNNTRTGINAMTAVAAALSAISIVVLLVAIIMKKKSSHDESIDNEGDDVIELNLAEL